MSRRLFVYGSLGPSGPNHHILEKLEGCWTQASVRGRLVDSGWGTQLGYPALEIDHQAAPVFGHVFESPRLADAWPALDSFEGDQYRRVLTEVRLADGSCVDAFVYVARG